MAHTARSKGKGTGKAPRRAAAGQDRHTGQARARAADGGTQGRTQGKGQGDWKDEGASSSARRRMQRHEQGAKAIGSGGDGQRAETQPRTEARTREEHGRQQNGQGRS